MPAQRLGEVGADRVEVGPVLLGGVVAAGVGGFGEQQRRALGDGVPGGGGQHPDHARLARADDVLHLHRLDDHDRRPGPHEVALGRLDAHDRALHGRGDGDRSRRRVRHGGGLRLGGVRGGLGVVAAVLALQQLGQVAADEGRVRPAGGELGVAQDALEQRDARGHARDLELAERPVRPRGGGRQVLRAGDHLGEQRVVAQAGAVPGVAAGVDADAGPGRRRERGERPGAGVRRAVRADRLGVDPHLDGAAGRRRRRGQAHSREVLPQREPELGLHQVDAGDLLGDGVLDLQPRVGLQEPELRARDEELERAEALVADAGGHPHRRVQQRGPRRGGQRGRGRDLDQLLVATLDAAVALPQVGDGARPVPGDLDLDVAGARHVLLRVQVAGAERGERLRPATLVRGGHLVRVLDDAHAAPAAARERLQHHRPVLARERLGAREVHGAAGARRHGHARRAGQVPRPRLVAEQLQQFGPRADEREPGGRAARGEGGVLAEEAVAGVDGGGPGVLGGGDERVRVEVAGDALPGQLPHLVGAPGVRRGRVVAGADGDGPQAQLGRGPHDPQRDLSPVGHKDPAHPASSPRLSRSALTLESGPRGGAPGGPGALGGPGAREGPGARG